MTEVQKRRELIKLIRIQWLIIIGLLIAFIIALVFACIPAPVPAAADATSMTWPADTAAPSKQQVTAMPLVSVSEPTLVPNDPEIINLGTYKLTAYCPCEKCCGIWSAEHASRKGTNYVQKTASGTIPKEGRTVAVDTSVIPFGTTIVIDGHEYVAEDRGGAVKENVIDIFFENHEDAVNFGLQYKTIYIKGDNYHD